MSKPQQEIDALNAIVNDGPITHHRLSPSSFPARSRCGKYTPDGGSRYSASGTSQHAIFASLFKGQLPLFLDEVTDSEMEGLKWAKEQVELKSDSDYPIEVERKLSYMNEKMEPVYYGTVDIVNGPNKIFDLKAGEEHAYWAQMAGYALALMDEKGSDWVDVVILYSRYKRIREYTIGRNSAEIALRDIIVKTEDPNAREVPNEFCDWCARMHECNAIHNRANIVSAHMDWVAESFNPSKLDDPEELAKALTVARLLKKWAKKVEDKAQEDKYDEEPPPGFRWKRFSGRKSIKDTIAAHKRSGLSMESILRASSITMSKLEEEYADGLGVTKKAAKEVLAERMADIITTTKPYKTLEEVKNQK